MGGWSRAGALYVGPGAGAAIHAAAAGNLDQRVARVSDDKAGSGVAMGGRAGAASPGAAARRTEASGDGVGGNGVDGADRAITARGARAVVATA